MAQMINKVLFTKDLAKFNALKGNRIVSPASIESMKRSMKENGFLYSSPIVVNKDMEVLDGQTRLAAARELGIGVAYMVAESLGIGEVRKLNCSQRTWSIADFIHSYAAEKKDFARLEEVLKESRVPSTIALKSLRIDPTALKAGRLWFSEKDALHAKAELEFLASFLDIETGRRSAFLKGIARVLRVGADKERLLHKCHTHSHFFKAITDDQSAIKAINSAYNYWLKEQPVVRLDRLVEDAEAEAKKGVKNGKN